MQAIAQRKFRLAEDYPGIGRSGEVVTMAVTPAETGDQLKVIDTYLGGYKNRAFCADVISPAVLVDQEKGTRLDFSADNVFERVDPRAGRQGGIKEVEHLNERTSYQTQEYALAAFIPWGAENDAVRQYNVRAQTSAMLLDKLLLDREYRVKEALTTLANWHTNNRTTISTSTLKWDATGGSAAQDPLGDLNARMSASARPVDLIVMNPDVAVHLLKNAEMRNFMRQQYGDERQADGIMAAASHAQDVQRVKLVGLPDILICPAKIKNTSTGLIEYVWPDDVVLLSSASGMSADEIASFMTFRTRGRSGSGVVTNEYMPYGRGINGGTMLEVGFGEDLFFPSNICGGLIHDVLT